MSQGTKLEEVAVGQKSSSSLQKSGLGGNGGESDKFVIKDPDLSLKLCQLVLDEYQSKPSLSQTTQTFSKRLSPELLDEAHSLAGSLNGSSRRRAKLANLTSEYFDKAPQHITISQAIKNQFAKLNLKFKAVFPEDFKLHIDCKHFKTSEIKVALDEEEIVVHAVHEHKVDEHGIVKREFKRRFSIPNDVKKDTFFGLLDRHEILIIQARRKPTSLSVPVQIEK